MQVNEATRNAGIGVCMSQAPTMLFLMATYPEPKSIVFIAHTAGNITSPEVLLSIDEYGLSVAYLLVSVCVVLFAFMTLQMQMAQAIDNMVEFTADSMGPLQIWDMTMWLTVLTSHILLTMQICSPVDLYLVLLTALGQTIALWAVCRPTRNQTGIMVVYLAGTMLVLSEMQTHHGLRLVVWCMLVIVDLLLVMGHTFDAQINLETIANCRVCYSTLMAVLLLLLYTV